MHGFFKKSLVLVGTGALAISMSACSSTRGGGSNDASGAPAGGSGSTLIGVAMPTKSLERWNRDGAYLTELLQKDGYEVSLQYADNKVEQQISQIQNMINKGAKVIVVASIDGEALGPALAAAEAKNIPVLAYDRLIKKSKAVKYYTTFDNYKVGKLQGEYIVKTLGLESENGPFNFEPFSGSPDDNNARFFFAGAWDVLKPYVDNGKLVVPSNKAPQNVDAWQSIGILSWDSTKAQAEMETRLNSFYQGKKVNVVLSPNDSLALGISQALSSAGYAPGPDYPLLTGQDADLANVKNILEGKQSMTVWKDTRALGEQVAKMVNQIVKGETVDVNDTKTYDNGDGYIVPSYLLDPVVITKDNVKEKLVDSNFYKASELGL